jgi:RNA polymerase sigma-70 factor (ECF subfamily)
VIYRRAYSLLLREADAWDVVHDVFAKLLENGSGFRREAQPMTYIYRVTTNVALNVLRSRKVRERDASWAGGDGLCEQEGADEARELLLRLLGQLDERAQQIATYHFLDDLTQEEIASIIGLSRKTVGKELARIREMARALAGEREAENG